MRSSILIAICVCVIGSGGSADGPKNVISIQPITALGFANIEYERALAPKVSLAGRVDVLYQKNREEEDEEGVKYRVDLSGFGGGASVRFYPLASAPKRAYAGIDIDVVRASAERQDTGEEGSATLFTLGGVIGWKWLIADAFAIALDFGTMFAAASAEVDDEDVGVQGLVPMAHFYIGIAF
jgi:hypothetical protein